MGFEEKLIGIVKRVPYLYNKKHSLYKNMQTKDAAWKGISQALKVDEHKCRAKWKSLRDQYIRELRRLKGSSHHGVKWKYFEALHFLQVAVSKRENPKDSSSVEEFISFKREGDNSEEISTQELPSSVAQESIDNPYSLDFNQIGENIISFPTHMSSTTKSAKTRKSNLSSINDSNHPSRRNDSELDENFQKFLESIRGRIHDREEEEDDYVDLFFRSLSKTVKSLSLPAMDFMDLQCKILALIKQECTKYKSVTVEEMEVKILNTI